MRKYLTLLLTCWLALVDGYGMSWCCADADDDVLFQDISSENYQWQDSEKEVEAR